VSGSRVVIYYGIDHMKRTAKLFLNGRSQAVRLPAEFRFEGSEVFVEKDPDTGNVILSPRPYSSWEKFFKLRDQVDVPEEFMSDRGDGPPQKRDLF
jgi:antitoxin VapB